MYLKISEVVSSLQGEGKFTGYPTTFVRLFGCNLKCSYCDAQYASVGKKKRMSIETIMDYIAKMGNKHVCITGGEPLMQDSIYCLIYELVDRNYIVSIETNGVVKIDPDNYKRSYLYVMDVKCPSSGMDHKNIYDNLRNLQAQDEVKFVISDINDYLFAKEIIVKYPTPANYIFSPVFINGKSNAKDLAQWILEDKLPKVRLGLQVHKIIGIY